MNSVGGFKDKIVSPFKKKTPLKLPYMGQERI